MKLKVVKQEKEKFSKRVEEFSLEANCTYLDAILELAEREKLELEIVPKLITARLKELLEIEATELNLLVGTDKNQGKLPI
jgi:hypothetical protein